MMLEPWFSSKKKKTNDEGVALAELALRVVSSAMGCFFGCFRIKDPHLVSPPEPVVSRNKNALSSLFLCDDELPGKREGGRNTLAEELDFRELKDEDKFLKACGTLPETPVEIRKASEKWEDISAQNGKEKSLTYKMTLHDDSDEELNVKKLPYESPTPVKVSEEWATGRGSLEDSPSSCMTDERNTRRCSISSIPSGNMKKVVTPTDECYSETHSTTSSVSPLVIAPTVQVKYKSVRFDCKFNESDYSSKDSSEGAKQSGSAGSSSVSKPSPYPTPTKLTDEMQTSGSQNLDDETTLMPGIRIKDISVGHRIKNEASPSSWLIPFSANKENDSEHLGSVSGENPLYGRTPGDRPILGMVAAHWKEEEMSLVSPTMWDGNGIPNSTHKYKEDQKVSWHATPFEERLEKALSEGSFVSQRQTISGTKPVEFDETEESDTALSHFQSSTNFKSVVSF